MGHNQNGGAACEMGSSPTRELLSRRVTGFITVPIVYLQAVLSGLVITGPSLLPRSMFDLIGTAFLFSLVICLLWGILIRRTCLRWALFCIAESLVSFAAFTLSALIH